MPHVSFFKHDMVPSDVAKRQRRRDDAKALAEAYAEVDLRDGGRCWVTGAYTGGVDPRTAREHHHLKGRNVRPEWVYKSERIITVTREAHRLITIGWIVVEGTDARKPIRFHWAEHVTPTMRPFQIRSRRTVPQERD